LRLFKCISIVLKTYFVTQFIPCSRYRTERVSPKLFISDKRYIILISVPKIVVHVSSVIFNPDFLKRLRGALIANRMHKK
jgi:hypothetical protein